MCVWVSQIERERNASASTVIYFVVKVQNSYLSLKAECRGDVIPPHRRITSYLYALFVKKGEIKCIRSARLDNVRVYMFLSSSLTDGLVMSHDLSERNNLTLGPVTP